MKMPQYQSLVSVKFMKSLTSNQAWIPITYQNILLDRVLMSCLGDCNLNKEWKRNENLPNYDDLVLENQLTTCKHDANWPKYYNHQCYDQ